MTEAPILRSERDAVLELVLNRPAKLNALTDEMVRLLRQGVDDFRDRDDLRVLLIRGVGRYFCAGVDLTRRERPDGSPFEGSPTAERFGGSPATARSYMRGPMMGGLQSLFTEIEKVEKPIVVAHHATCVGGGLELSLSCDFRLAAKSASYSFPEMVFGMLPLSGGISRFVRLCGPHWARWMVMANEPVSAERALMIGLVHDVYPDETFETDVWNFCTRLAQRPREAIAAGKLAIELCTDLPSEQSRQVERMTWSSLCFVQEFLEESAQVRKRLGG